MVDSCRDLFREVIYSEVTKHHVTPDPMDLKKKDKGPIYEKTEVEVILP